MDDLDIKAIFDDLTSAAKYYESDVKAWLQRAQDAEDDDAAAKAETSAADVVRCALRDRGYEFDDESEGDDATQ